MSDCEFIERELLRCVTECFSAVSSSSEDVSEDEIAFLASSFVELLLDKMNESGENENESESKRIGQDEGLLMDILEEMKAECGIEAFTQDVLFTLHTTMEHKLVLETATKLFKARIIVEPSFEENQRVIVTLTEGTEEFYLPGTIVEVMATSAMVQLDGFHVREIPLTHIGVDPDESSHDEEDQEGACEMCKRTTKRLTRHHLVPRETHSDYRKKGFTREFLNTTTSICRQCHSMVHRVESNDTLAQKFNTIEKIMGHPKIQAWVVYASKQKKGTKWDHKVMLAQRK
eukprot:m.219451 g.219451  ORF g.219451 m.219451 type:complete len:288 (+) comp13825_c1_seq1:276-1139(+)